MHIEFYDGRFFVMRLDGPGAMLPTVGHVVTIVQTATGDGADYEVVSVHARYAINADRDCEAVDYRVQLTRALEASSATLASVRRAG